MFIAMAALVALSGNLRPYTRLYTTIDAFPWWWIPVSLLLCLVVHDTYFYWMHRLLHHKSLFKRTACSASRSPPIHHPGLLTPFILSRHFWKGPW